MNTMTYSFIGSPAVYWRTDTVLDVWKTDVNKGNRASVFSELLPQFGGTSNF